MKIFIIILLFLAVGFILARTVLKQSVGQLFGVGEFVAVSFIAGAGLAINNPLLFFPVALLVAMFPWPKTPVQRIVRFIVLCSLTPEFTFNVLVGGIHLIDLRPRDMYLLGLAVTSLAAPNARNDRPFGAEFMVLMALVSVTWLGGNRDAAASDVVRTGVRTLIDFPLTFYFIYRNIRSRKDLMVVLGVGVAASIVLGVFAIYEARAGWSVFEVMLRHLQDDFMSRNTRIRAGLMRSTTTFTEPTSFAVFQMTFLVVAISARDLFRNSLAWIGGCAIIAIGLLATQSRGAIIGAVAGTLLAMIVSRAFGRAALAGAFVAMSGWLVVGLAKGNARLGEFVSGSGIGSAEDYRQRLLRRGTEEGMKHFWLGDGIRSVYARMPDLLQGEKIIDPVNTYLYFFWAGGVAGLAAIVLLVLAVLGRLIMRGFKQRTGAAFVPEATLSGMMAAILVAILFTSFYERNPLWLVIVLACTRALARPGFFTPSAPLVSETNRSPDTSPSNVGAASLLVR